MIYRDRGPDTAVVSYFFPPSAETAGIVTAKRIVEWGRPVDVYAALPTTDDHLKSSTKALVGDLVTNITRVNVGPPVLQSWQAAEQFANRVFRRMAMKGLLTGRRYKTVYSRSMMPASHLAAAEYVLRYPKTRWIAEFSDPLVFDTRAQIRQGTVGSTALARKTKKALAFRTSLDVDSMSMFELIEHMVYVFADSILFTNESQRDVMLSGISDNDLRGSVMVKTEIHPHPVPKGEMYETVPCPVALDPTRLNIGYFGTFYGVRGFSDIAAIVNSLDENTRREVRFHVFTDKVKRSRRLVKQGDLADVISIKPYLAYLPFLAATRGMDLLVAFDARASEKFGVNPYLPSKLADYLGSGTPVWGVADGESPMSKVPGIHITQLDDLNAAQEFLRSLLRETRRR